MKEETCNIAGKWALVTGSSRGVGQQVAKALSEKGCNVVLHSRKEGGCAKTRSMLASGVEVREVWGELSIQGEAKKIANRALELAGQIDILYNNAAIMTPWAEMFETPQSDYELSFQVNVYSMLDLCSALVPAMKERGWGRVVNVTSGIGFEPHLTPYCLTKISVDKLTSNLAVELKGSGVLANTMDPGWLKTDLGGDQAPGEVESVIPGALVPVLLADNGVSGELFHAQDYAE